MDEEERANLEKKLAYLPAGTRIDQEMQSLEDTLTAEL